MRIIKLGRTFLNLEHVAAVADEEVALSNGSVLDLTFDEVKALESYLERICEVRLEVKNERDQDS